MKEGKIKNEAVLESSSRRKFKRKVTKLGWTAKARLQRREQPFRKGRQCLRDRVADQHGGGPELPPAFCASELGGYQLIHPAEDPAPPPRWPVSNQGLRLPCRRGPTPCVPGLRFAPSPGRVPVPSLPLPCPRPRARRLLHDLHLSVGWDL